MVAFAVLLLGCGSSDGRSAISVPTSAPPLALAGAGSTKEVSGVNDGMYTVSANGRVLTVAVAVGGGCQEQGTASVQALEGATEVVLTVSVNRPKSTSSPPATVRACPADLIEQNVPVQLSRALDGRRVIDASTDLDLQAKPR